MAPLHKAAKSGSPEDVSRLLRAGSDVNALDFSDRTPLHYSAKRGCLDIVEQLIYFGADVNARSEKGSTPLHYSAAEGHSKIVKMLIHFGADINAKNSIGITPLMCSALSGILAPVKILIAAGADVNTKMDCGFTALHGSVVYGYKNIVKALIVAGADVNAKNINRKTPLDIASKRHLVENCKFLIKYTLLYTYNPKKPKFKYDPSAYNEIWSLCEEQVKNLKETFLGNSHVSFFQYLKETDENKLALYASEYNFGISSELGRASYIQQFPFYAEDVEDQFIKGTQRANMLLKSQEMMKLHVFKMLPTEIIMKITEYLENEDLESYIFSHKFIKK